MTWWHLPAMGLRRLAPLALLCCMPLAADAPDAQPSAPDLIVLDKDKSCTMEELAAGACGIRLRAEGGAVLDIKGTPDSPELAKRLTTNQFALPDDGTGLLKLKFASSAGPPLEAQSVKLIIDWKLASTQQKPKEATVTIRKSTSVYEVFDGKPVSVLLRRGWSGPFAQSSHGLGAMPSGTTNFLIRSTAAASPPQLIAWEFHRMVGEELYALQGSLHDPVLRGEAGIFPFQVAISVPSGNFTAASGDLWFRSPDGSSLKVPLQLRIKDTMYFPLLVLIAGHLALWVLRRTTEGRPRKLLQLRLLNIEQDLRVYERDNTPLSAQDQKLIREIRAEVATGRRLLEQLDTSAASEAATRAESSLKGLGNGVAAAATVAAATPAAPPPSEQPIEIVRRLARAIRRNDLLVESVAMAISILLGAQLYTEADRFGTYSDYVKILLFAAGISTSTQGFSNVLARLNAKQPTAANGS